MTPHERAHSRAAMRGRAASPMPAPANRLRGLLHRGARRWRSSHAPRPSLEAGPGNR